MSSECTSTHSSGSQYLSSGVDMSSECTSTHSSGSQYLSNGVDVSSECTSTHSSGSQYLSTSVDVSSECISTHSTGSQYLSTGVDVSTWVTDSDGTDNFTMAQRAHLASMAWNSRSNECIRWKRHRLHLSICTDMEWVGPDRHTYTPVSYTHLTLPTILRV